MSVKVLLTANPNRHGVCTLEQEAETFFVYLAENEDPWCFDSYTEAKEFWDHNVGELANTPNWEAQAEYDELHGTDNGGDPRCAYPEY